MSEKGTIAYQEMTGDGWQTCGIVSYGRHAPRSRQLPIMLKLYEAGLGVRRVVESYYERGRTWNRPVINSTTVKFDTAGVYEQALQREPDGDILFAN